MDQLSLLGQFDRPNTTSWKPSAPPCLDGIDEIELDVETTGLRWWAGDHIVGIAIRTPDGKCQYLPVRHRGENLDEEKVREWARHEIRGKKITNLSTRFDNHMMYKWGVDLEAQGCTLADVGHYAALLDDHRKSFSLENISRDYLGKGKIKGLNLVGGAQDYFAGELAAYAEQDVRLVGELKQVMLPLLAEQDLMRVVELENEVIFPVCEMERNGAPLDMEKLERWRSESTKEVHSLIWKICKESGVRVEPTKRDSLVRLFKTLHLPVPTKMGANGMTECFDAEHLAGYEHPIIKDLKSVRKLISLKSKFIDNYSSVHDHGILRFELHQLRVDNDEESGGTVTGRFSSSNVNIQQVMSAEKQIALMGDHFIIRELFTGDRRLFLSADAKQIEYRIFASYSGSKTILRAYRDDPDTDYHAIVWQMVKKIRSEFTRKRTKDINFAKLFGAGIGKLALMFACSIEEAQDFSDIYDREFPEAGRLLRKASKRAEDRGFVRTVLGRRSRFPTKERLHKALNSVIQGSAADINKKKLVELHKERKSTGFTMRFTVHDEVCGDVPDLESAAKVRAILDRQSFSILKVPILWDAKTGPNWKDLSGVPKEQFPPRPQDGTRGGRSD